VKFWHLAAGIVAVLILRGTMSLSKNFTLAELTSTTKPFSNVPGPEELKNLERVARELLQPIRDKWGPIYVSSGFRSLEVNSAVGGSKQSQHMKGEAADIKPRFAMVETVFNWIVLESGIEYGQVIYEVHGAAKWIHISLPRPYRMKQALLLINGVTSYA
jgi:hypothetical protein